MPFICKSKNTNGWLSYRKMVSKKAKKLGIVVYHHEFNSYEYITSVLTVILGYEHTQAANCAHMISKNGNYLVKTFPAKDKVKANAYVDMFTANEVPVQLILI